MDRRRLKDALIKLEKKYDDMSDEELNRMAKRTENLEADPDREILIQNQIVQCMFMNQEELEGMGFKGSVHIGTHYSWANIDDVFPTETTVEIVIPASETLGLHSISEVIENIIGTNKNISSILMCSLTRDGSHVDDTYPDDIYVLALDFHIPVDSLGSRKEYIK